MQINNNKTNKKKTTLRLPSKAMVQQKNNLAPTKQSDGTAKNKLAPTKQSDGTAVKTLQQGPAKNSDRWSYFGAWTPVSPKHQRRVWSRVPKYGRIALFFADP